MIYYILQDTSDETTVKCKVHIHVPSLRLHLENYPRQEEAEEKKDAGIGRLQDEQALSQRISRQTIIAGVKKGISRFEEKHGSCPDGVVGRITDVMSSGVPPQFVEHLTQVFLLTQRDKENQMSRQRLIGVYLTKHRLNYEKLTMLFSDFVFTTPLGDLEERVDIWVADLRCQAMYAVVRNDSKIINRLSEICGQSCFLFLLREAKDKQAYYQNQIHPSLPEASFSSANSLPRLFYASSLSVIKNLWEQYKDNPPDFGLTLNRVNYEANRMSPFHVKESDWYRRMLRFFDSCFQNKDLVVQKANMKKFAQEKRISTPTEQGALAATIEEVFLGLISGEIAENNAQFVEKLCRMRLELDDEVRRLALEYEGIRGEEKQDGKPVDEAVVTEEEIAYNIYLDNFLREIEEDEWVLGLKAAQAKAVAKKGNKKKKRKKKKAARAAEQHRSERAKENSSAVRSLSPFDIERFLEYAHQVLPERLQSVENYASGIGIEPDANFRRLKKEIEAFVARLPFPDGGDVLTRHKICELDQEVQASLRALERWVEDKLEALMPDGGGPDQEQILDGRMSDFICHVFDVIAKADLAEARNNGESTCVDVTPEMVPHINRYFHNLRLKLNREIRIGNKRRFLKMNEALAFYVTRKSKTPDILFCISVHRWRLRQKPDLDRKNSQSLAHMDERFWEDLDKRDRNSFYVLHIPKPRK